MATYDVDGDETDAIGENFNALLSKLEAKYTADVGKLRTTIANLRQEGFHASERSGKSIEEVGNSDPIEAASELPCVVSGSEPTCLNGSKSSHYDASQDPPFHGIVCAETTEQSDLMGREPSIESSTNQTTEVVAQRTSVSSMKSFGHGFTPEEMVRQSLSVKGFRLHADWTTDRVAQLDEDVDDHHVEADTRKLLRRVGTNVKSSRMSKRVNSRDFREEVRSKWVIDPGSDVRMSWDIAGMVLIAWDLITVTLLFWTADMGWSVCTGFFKEGRLVTNHKAIFLRYLRTWFVVDLLVVVPDWVMTLLGSSSNVGKLGRLLKAARVIRVLRLLRLLKLRRLVNELYDRIASELMFIVVELIKLLTFILVLNHLVACSWYLVGYIGLVTNARKNWLQDVGMTPAWGEDLAWRYFTSLHWSITQFTPASMDISATNTGERIFSIFILFFALVALSSVISSVSSAMTVIRNMSGDKQKQFWMLRRYMTQRGVSKDLSGRIVKYLEHRLQSKSKTLLPSRVLYLTQLSDHLANQLSFETNAPALTGHTFFKATMAEHPSVMYRICSVAIRQIDFAIDDEVFGEGELAASMYFVRTGIFAYRTSFTVEKKCYISEAALWTPWYHRGNLVCADEIGELIAVKIKEFGNVMRAYPKTWDFALEYAHLVLEYMNEMEKTQLTDVTHITIDVDFANASLRDSGDAPSSGNQKSVVFQRGSTRSAWP